MKALFLVLLGLGCCFILPGSDFSIFHAGRPDAVLILPKNSSPQLKTAVRYFNAELAKSTGKALPERETEPVSGNRIVFRQVQSSYIDRSRYTIDFPTGRTMRITGTPLAIRYALNGIIEKAGIRYPFPGQDGAWYPVCRDLKLPAEKVVKDAAFRIFRSIFSMDNQWQLNLNCQLQDSRELCNHGVDRTFPLKKYGKGEWVNKILPVRFGKRELKPVWNIWEPCYSNPATASEAVKNISEYLRKHPGQTCYSLVVNDGWNYYCMCPECEKANQGPKTTSLEPQLANRSEVYYKWVNKVAREIRREFPNVTLGVLAYNCVKNPPSFKLEDNVVVTIACEAYALSDPVMREKLREMYRIWKDRARYIGIWEYGYGVVHYSLPRVFFKYQAEQIRWFARNHGEVGFVEAMPNFGQGPHLYLYLKLFYDPSIDVEKTLDEWYEAAVGKEAAPYLKQYYEFWNGFWDGPAKKTAWFNSVRLVYLALGIDGSYHNAVRPGMAEKCRALMEKTVAAANRSGDAGQKKRAAYLMKEFELYEASMILNGMGRFDFSGNIASPADALFLARNLPVIAQAAVRRRQIAEEISKTFPSWWGGIYPKFYPASFKKKYTRLALPQSIPALLPYLDRPEIRAAYLKSIQDPRVPAEWKELLSILGNASGIRSMIEDSSFEAAEAANWKPAGKRSGQFAHSGKFSAEFKPTSGLTRFYRVFQNHPDKRYLVMARVLVPADYPPGRAQAKISLNGRTKIGYNTISYNPAVVSLVPGQWNMVYSIAKPGQRAVKGEVILTITGMKPGDRVYVDDIKLIEAGE